MAEEQAIDDILAAAAFRRLVRHLGHRTDVQNVDLMGVGGFCRNCLADWVLDAAHEHGRAMTKDEARALIYGMPQSEWKAKYQTEATPEQLRRMDESVAKNRGDHAGNGDLDQALEQSEIGRADVRTQVTNAHKGCR